MPENTQSNNATSLLPPVPDFCFVCGSIMRNDGSCSNPDCPMYFPPKNAKNSK